MKTRIDIDAPTDLLTPAMNKLRKQMRSLAKAQRTLERKQARARKQFEREAYEWAALGE